MMQPHFALLLEDSRFAYDLIYETIWLPDIFATERIFPEEGEDEYARDYRLGNMEWVIFGVNHEYLHFIIHRLIDSDACKRMDFLEAEEFL